MAAKTLNNRGTELSRIRRLFRRFLSIETYMIKMTKVRNQFITDRYIASGPFKGIRYVNKSLSGRNQSALLGTYEKELWPFIDHANTIDFDLIVNVGAGEGYYAVGLAVRHPTANVVAFETNEKNRDLIMEGIRLNKIKNLQVNGVCDITSLQRIAGGRMLIIMDVEGAELHLLDPDTIPQLFSSYIIVELHDFIDPSISDTIRNRFSHTHNITLVKASERTLADFPLELRFPYNIIPKRYDLEAIQEIRGGKLASWYYLIPNIPHVSTS